MKLEVPDPDAPETPDYTELSMELWVGLILSVCVIFFGVLLWIQPHHSGDDEADDPDDEPAQQQQDDEHARLLERIEQEGFEGHEDSLADIFTEGPRRFSEQACRHFEDDIAEGTAPEGALRVLSDQVRDRAGSVPWHCLTYLFLRDRLSEGELADAVGEYWTDVEELQLPAEMMRPVVERMREDVPDHRGFDRWLRRCALSLDYPLAGYCHAAIQNTRSGWGDDLLEVVFTHLDRAVEPGEQLAEDNREELQRVAETLNAFARLGQPPGWRIQLTETIPQYDQAFRRAAVFQLCRMVNSPHEQVQTYAVEGLAAVAGVAVHATDTNTNLRWRGVCRRAFGDPDDPDQPFPLLGVTTGDDQQTVDYTLEVLAENGLCEMEEDFPDWYCGYLNWTGGQRPVGRVLQRHFRETNYMGWYDAEQLDDVEREIAVVDVD